MSQWWWKSTGDVFRRMLEEASYPAHSQHSHVAFFYFFVLPEFGGDPIHPRFTEQTHHDSTCLLWKTDSSTLVERSSCLPAEHGRHTFRSYMTDDHSPIELSCIYSDNGPPVIRFAIDPVLRQERGDQPAMAIFEDMASMLSLSPDEDLAWCRVCANELTVWKKSGQDAVASPKHPSQYFIGFDFNGESVGLKAYFLTEARASSSGTSKLDLVTTVVRNLAQTSGQVFRNLITAWDVILAFFRTLPFALTPQLEIVAVDCVPSHMNRLKVYLRAPLATMSTIRLFMTLGSTLHQTSVDKALECIAWFWRLLFPGLSEDEEPEVSEDRLRHHTGGLLFYYELRTDRQTPCPKVYIPVRHLCKDDEEVVCAMEQLYSRLGLETAARQYGRFVRNVFSHRPLLARTGIHTYIAFTAKPDMPEVTAYFNPECFSDERLPSRATF